MRRRLSVALGAESAVPRAGRVLVAVDFSTPSLAAARWVARHLAPDAEIVLAHVLPVPNAPAFLRAHLRAPDQFVEAVSAPMRGGLEGLAEALGGDRRVQVELRVGEPAEELAALAAAHEVELICVGRPRHRGDTVKLGRNTVDRLLRQTTTPLLQATGPLEGPPANILAAVDGGTASGQVLGAGWALAARLEARLTALHVLDEDVRAYVRAMEVAIGAAADARGAEEALWTTTSEWLTEALESAGARAGRFEAVVRNGDPGQEVLGAVRQLGADMIVLGRNGDDALSTHAVGSTTRLVLRAAPCPVLVIPEVPDRVTPIGPDRGRHLAPVVVPVAPSTAPATGRRAARRQSGGDGMPPAAERRSA